MDRHFVNSPILSRVGGLALSGAALSAFAGRPLLALAAALSFGSVVFCLGVFCFGALSFPAFSRAAAKSTTLPAGAGAGSPLSGVSVCLPSLSGLGGSVAAWPGASGTVDSAFSTGAAFSAGAGSAATGSAFSGAGGFGVGGVLVFSTSGLIFFLSSANVKPPFREMKKASPMAGSR